MKNTKGEFSPEALKFYTRINAQMSNTADYNTPETRRALIVPYDGISNEDFLHLRELPDMESFFIMGDNYNDEDHPDKKPALDGKLLQYIPSSKKIHAVYIESLANLGRDDIAHLRMKLPNLTKLAIVDCDLTKDVMQQIGLMKNLVKLNIENCNFEYADLGYLALNKLSSLYINGSTDPRDVSYYEEFGEDSSTYWDPYVPQKTQNKILEELKIDWTENIDVLLEKMVPRFRDIKKLGVLCDSLSDKGLAHIAKLNQLEKLDIGYTFDNLEITEAGLNALDIPNWLPNLVDLKLDGTQASREAINKAKALVAANKRRLEPHIQTITGGIGEVVGVTEIPSDYVGGFTIEAMPYRQAIKK